MFSLAAREFYELGGVVLFDRVIKRINSQLIPIWCWAYVGLLLLALCHLWLLCLRHMLPFCVVAMLYCCGIYFYFLTCLTCCLSWAAVGKHSPPSVAPWRWTTSKMCVPTAFSRRCTMILRMKTMRWATLTPSRTTCMHARWASNPSLLAMNVTTSSYQSYGLLKKIFTYRRSKRDLRGDPGTRRYKASGLLIDVQPQKCLKSNYSLKNPKWSVHANVTLIASVNNYFFCTDSYLRFLYHCLLPSFPVFPPLWCPRL